MASKWPKLKYSDRIVVELLTSEIFEGDYQGGSANHIDVLNPVYNSSGDPIIGNFTFYKSEIVTINLISDNPPENAGSSKIGNVVQMCKLEYERLKNVTENYIYMATIDKRFADAIEHLQNCENIAVVGIGTEFGRCSKLSLLLLASWDQIYIFDVMQYRSSKFIPELKNILESDSIKKVVHNSSVLVDCLHHVYGVNIDNIFDVQVADMMVTNKLKKTVVKKSRTLAECLVQYFNLPNMQASHDIDKQEYGKRPLNDATKLRISLLGTHLIVLKNKLESLMLQDFYQAVDIYSKCLQKTSAVVSQMNVKNYNFPVELIEKLEKL